MNALVSSPQCRNHYDVIPAPDMYSTHTQRLMNNPT
jgi:hypothetical protein